MPPLASTGPLPDTANAKGEPFSFYAQGAPETVDVRFRSADPTLFKQYMRLPFDRASLVKVITGPAIRHQLVESTVRRLLDRNGFRHTVIEPSKLP
jgi:hypothetical protein